MNRKCWLIIALMAAGACVGRMTQVLNGLRKATTSLSFIFLAIYTGHGTLVFSESTGTPSGNTEIANYTGWQNNGALTFTGTGDVRKTSPSNGYTGASGNGNVFLTYGEMASFQIGSINTVGYGTLTLSFGAYKSTIGSTMSELALQYSTDGTTWTSLAIPAQPTGEGTAIWRLIPNINLPSNAEGVSELDLRWINTASADGAYFRLDDITLTGSAAVVPEPAICGVIAGTVLLAFCAFELWREGRFQNHPAAV